MGESANEPKLQDDQEANALVKNEHRGTKLANEIKTRLASLEPLPESPGCCIYKVPDPLRKSNKEAYTPQVISIGPFHRDNKKLQAMKRLKLGHLKALKERENVDTKDLVSTIKAAEESVRECYSETIPLSSDDFVKMILIDASFIIEFFWRNWAELWTEYDRELIKPWLSNRLQLDLMLLENQLPFFIIEKIYDIAMPDLSIDHPFIELCFDQFDYHNVQKKSHHDLEWKIMHFVDLLRFFCLPPRERRPERSAKIVKKMHSATQLKEVGLKFKLIDSSSSCTQLELKYADHGGELEIPKFKLDDTMEIYAGNLMALEECHYPHEAYITDYYILLRFLIRTNKDMDLLVHDEIIANWLDDINQTFINKLCINVVHSGMNNDYHSICEGLNKFHQERVTYVQKLKAALIRDYFFTPWMGASTIAAIILLVLTIIQTICSLIPLF
ncbi:UPF0481 protein At3g47200-like [Juglans microcarpa x Juglans regia]|uniref:UPF0481 protein At3g47200-like n=1 Tax=Juglans microcarpa x Juglans regia TaxID=2249226 RepID=UPI001B7EA07C|nr:UPF0481 protein At3g47200-like [Juglans microcarpa x Juglans regia]